MSFSHRFYVPVGVVALSSPPADPGVGDTYFDTSLGKLRTWTGSGWIEAAPGTQGPQGVKGDKGDQGVQGPIGLTGPQGETGIQGVQGLQGVQGEPGPEGAVGPQGLKGDTGAQGPVGPKGATGAAGPQGLKGDTGAQGPVGPEGDVGPVGPQGDKGATGGQGVQGPVGATGATGPTGPTGAKGDTGAEGPKGGQGNPGVAGPVGPTGPAGQQGIQGVQGPTGPTGVIGPTGPQGPAGADGDASGAIADHLAAADPHPQYQKEAEKGAAGGYASLDANIKVPITQVPTGTTAGTVALGDHTHSQYAANTTQVIAGNGLTGGGTLAANRTLAVGGGVGITVAADTVAVDTAVIQAKSEKGVAGGYAPLDGNNHVPTLHLPPLAVNEVFTVATQAAMLALNAQRGDMAIRTDNGKTYVLSTDVPSVLANWKEVMATGQVVSVNGATGVVTITLAGLGGAAAANQVIAGAGLTGGGTLAANRTLDVGAGAGITVAADTVAVDAAVVQFKSEKNTAGGYAGLDAGTKVAFTQLPVGTTATTVAVGNHNHDGLYDPAGSAVLQVSAHTSTPDPHPQYLTQAEGDARYSQRGWAGLVPAVAAGGTCLMTHNLGSRDVTVQVYRNGGNYESVQCDVQRTNTNVVTLHFAEAVANSALRCVITRI